MLSDSTGSYHYAVTSVEVVPNTAMWIVDQHPGRTLTIFTCHPIGSSAERLVVHAELRTRARARRAERPAAGGPVAALPERRPRVPGPPAGGVAG